MTHTGQVAGAIGPFTDPVSGQPLNASAQGSLSFNYGGDPNAVLGHLNAGVLRATTAVIQQKIAANQVALPTLPSSLPYFIPEIVAQSGAASMGVQITQLSLNVQVQQPAAPVMAPAPMPPTPWQSTANAFKQAAQDELDPRNYEVEATVNVGGFKLKGSTDKGFDTDGLKKQVADKAKSTVIWWGIGCAVIAFAGLLIAGIAGYVWWEWKESTAPAAASGAPTKATWDGASEFRCAANDNLRLEGVTANLTKGTAITAAAGCHLEIVNCNITAPVGIEALASAVVVVQGGSVKSSTLAAKAMGNASIKFSGTTVTGKTQALGAAKITGP